MTASSSAVRLGLSTRTAAWRDQREQSWARRLVLRKRFWILLLAAGFWLARPYYIPWTAAEERDADTRATAAQGSVERQVGMPFLGLLACYMLFRTPNAPRFKGRLAWEAAAYCAWMAVSLAWSVDPATTLKRLTVFYLCVLVLIAMAKCFTIMELAEIGFYVSGIVAVIALLTEIFLTHSFAPFDPDYRMMGVMSSNSQGQNLTVCVFCGLALLQKHPSRLRWMVPCLGFAATLLYLTRSRTATFTCLLLSLFFLKRIIDAKFAPEKRMVFALVLLAVAAPLLIVLGSRIVPLLEDTFMMGRADAQNTASLSNRAPLWAELSDYVGKRPVLGYGYNTFWTSDTITLISAHQGWGVPNAHNTYLDQELSAGIVAMVLFAAVFWGCAIRAWLRYARNPCAETLLPPILLTWLILTSLVESVPIDPFLPTMLVYACLVQTLMPEGTGLEAASQSGAATPASVAA